MDVQYQIMLNSNILYNFKCWNNFKHTGVSYIPKNFSWNNLLYSFIIKLAHNSISIDSLFPSTELSNSRPLVKNLVNQSTHTYMRRCTWTAEIKMGDSYGFNGSEQHSHRQKEWQRDKVPCWEHSHYWRNCRTHCEHFIYTLPLALFHRTTLVVHLLLLPTYFSKHLETTDFKQIFTKHENNTSK